MVIDETETIRQARRVVGDVTIDDVQLPPQSYIHVLHGIPDNIVVEYDGMGTEEAGYTMLAGSKQVVVINKNDSPERQRFTLCHELAHIILGLPTEHSDAESGFTWRSKNEILCDVFAAELLLPHHLFRPLVEDAEIGFASIRELARQFSASLTAIGSRFAFMCDRPCAFVIMKGEKVRYASISQELRESGGRIYAGQKVPPRSLATKVRESHPIQEAVEVDAVEWLDGWRRGGVLLEEACHVERWDQTLSLLWFEDEEIPSPLSECTDDDDEEPALTPLDGELPWPSKSRRR